MRRAFMGGLLAMTLAAMTGSANAAPPPAKPAADAGIVKVEMDTTKGKIIVAIETKRAPITAANFLHYVDTGKLNGVPFWRAAHSGDSGFIQVTMKGPTFPPIAHEPTNKTGLRHTDGALSMSRFDVGTATADFIICIGDNSYMDAGHHNPPDNQGYAVFGHVVSGMSVVRAIDNGRIDRHTRQGGWAGQMLKDPVMITQARRLP